MKNQTRKVKNTGQDIPGFELMNFAMNKVHEAAYLVDQNACLHYVNENACQVLGYSKEELLSLTVADIDPDYPSERWTDHWIELRTKGSLIFEGRHKRKNGEIFPVEVNANYFEFEGQAYNLALVRDITDRKRTMELQNRLNRELRAISNCNQALLHAEDEQSLLSEICNIICNEAGYRLAWVGFAENDQAKTIRPVAWAGFDSGYIENARLSWSDETEYGRGPAGIVVRTGEMMFVQDFAVATVMTPWRESAIQRGYRSGIALPLKDKENKVFGVLLIYSSEKEAITPDEIKLMDELAGDLAFGIIALRTSIGRKQAVDALAEQFSTLQNIIDHTNAIIFSVDRNYRYTSFNLEHARVMKSIYGAEIRLEQNLLDYMTVPEDCNKAKKNLDRALSGEKVMEESLSGEEQLTRRYFQVFHSPILSRESEIIGVAVLSNDITDRREMELAMRKNQKDLKEAQRVGRIGSWDWDAATDIITWSEEYCRICGHDPDIPPPNYLDHLKAYTPESAARLDAAVKRNLESGESYELDLEFAHEGGKRKWITARSETKVDDNGKIIGLRGTAQDITERKLAEEQILKMNRIYAALSNISQAIVRVHDAREIMNEACRIAVQDGKFKMAWIGMINEQTKKVDVVASYGFQGDYLENINIDLNDWRRSSGPTGLAIRTGKHKISNNVPEDESMSPWKEDAKKYGFNSVASFALIVGGKITGAFTIYDSELNFFLEEDINLLDEMVNDIAFALEFIETEAKRKQVEEGLKEFKLATEQSPASIVITNLEGEIEYANPKFSQISGYSLTELIGKNPRILKSGEMSKVEYKTMWDTILSGAEWRGEFHNRRKDGNLYWESASISPIKDNNGKITHFIAVKEDITEQKRLENNLREAIVRAEEMSRLKSSLLLNMSHELRTPMNGILGFSNLLKEQPLDEESQKMVDVISSSGKRLMSTLNSILDLAQAEAGKQNLQIIPVKINDLVAGIQSQYQEQAENKHLMYTCTCEEEVYSLLDERLLLNILHHLLDNAIKFTDSGSISLILKKEASPKKSSAVITVKDSGIGIPPDKMNLIFDAFRQGSEGIGRSYEGTGLGLTLCKKFVELLNGDISVDSIPGIGSTFTVKFPLFIPAADEKIAKPSVEIDIENEVSRQVENRKGKASVLIVEDNVPNCELMEIYLRAHCHYDTVHSGKQAVKNAFMNQYDLILMDINLGPDMDGIEATREIRSLENYKNIPIIAVTGFSTVEEKERILSGGLNQILTKPFTREELLGIVKKLI